jgi:hypothetical protein
VLRYRWLDSDEDDGDVASARSGACLVARGEGGVARRRGRDAGRY